jgi:hypothetical protein
MNITYEDTITTIPTHAKQSAARSALHKDDPDQGNDGTTRER